MRLIICLMLLSACTPALRHPAPFGFFNVQCEELRKVVCVPDADMSAEICHRVAGQAISAINQAVGRPVLVLGDDLQATPEAVGRAVEAHMIPVWAEALPDGILGLTGVRHAENSACISVAFVRLAPGVAESPIGAQVLTHELVHALGGAHATESGFESIMTPAISDPAASRALTPGDQEALARVYGPA